MEEAKSAVLESDGLLVVGSSLTVWSGFRFAQYAHDNSIPVVILSIGANRAENIAHLKLEASIGDVLKGVCHELNIPL